MVIGAQNMLRCQLVACGLWPATYIRDPSIDEDAACDLRLWCEERFGARLQLIYLPSCPAARRAQIEAQLACPLKEGPCVVILNDKAVLTAASRFLAAICLAALALQEMIASGARVEIKQA